MGVVRLSRDKKTGSESDLLRRRDLQVAIVGIEVPALLFPGDPLTRSSCSIRSWLGCRLWGLRQALQIGNLGGGRSQEVINKHWVAVRLARDP